VTGKVGAVFAEAVPATMVRAVSGTPILGTEEDASPAAVPDLGLLSLSLPGTASSPGVGNCSVLLPSDLGGAPPGRAGDPLAGSTGDGTAADLVDPTVAADAGDAVDNCCAGSGGVAPAAWLTDEASTCLAVVVVGSCACFPGLPTARTIAGGWCALGKVEPVAVASDAVLDTGGPQAGAKVAALASHVPSGAALDGAVPLAGAG
jgi:hypothetical protein